MSLVTDYEGYSLKQLLEEYSSLEDQKIQQANNIFKLIEMGVPGEDPAVKVYRDVHVSLFAVQKSVAIEFIRRFVQ